MIKITKDYILVRDYETAAALAKRVVPSLAGKHIIVAPNGLEFVSKEDILNLPQVKKLLEDQIDKIKKALNDFQGDFSQFGSASGGLMKQSMLQYLDSLKEGSGVEHKVL